MSKKETEKKIENFLVHQDMWPLIEVLPDTDFRPLLEAMFRYAKDKTEPTNVTPTVAMAFNPTLTLR